MTLAEGMWARSDAELISKIETALQELVETRYWFEVLRDSEILPWNRWVELDGEAGELTSILVSIVKKLKRA